MTTFITNICVILLFVKPHLLQNNVSHFLDIIFLLSQNKNVLLPVVIFPILHISILILLFVKLLILLFAIIILLLVILYI